MGRSLLYEGHGDGASLLTNIAIYFARNLICIMERTSNSGLAPPPL